MKKTIGLSAALLVLLVSAAVSAGLEPALGGKSGDASAAAPDAAVGKIRPQFVFGIHGTLSNSYNRGNLDDWFGELTGDPDRQVDQGSPAFWGLEATMFMPVRADAIMLGASLGFTIPASHSLWGTQLYFGGRQELVLNPMIFSFGLPLKFQLGSSQRFYASVKPAMLMGWVTGTYTSETTWIDFTPAPSFGFGVSGEWETMISRMFGFDATLGFRVLKADLAFENASSETGYSQPLLDNGEEVQADLGGMYMTLGLSLHL